MAKNQSSKRAVKYVERGLKGTGRTYRTKREMSRRARRDEKQGD